MANRFAHFWRESGSAKPQAFYMQVVRPVIKIKSVSRDCQQFSLLKPGMMILEVNGVSQFSVDEVLRDIHLTRANHKALALTVIPDFDPTFEGSTNIGKLKVCIVEAESLPRMDYIGG
eukprot:SAG11_NODE_627_length_8087_cov_3.567852_5_plen_118_part_00